MKPETLLFRQVHPTFVQADGVSTQAFKPTSKDNNKLSVYDGDRFTPEQSFNHYVATNKTAGVLGVAISECEDQGLKTIADDQTFPGHASIDYSECSRKEMETKAKILRNIAIARDWLFKPKEKEAEAPDS